MSLQNSAESRERFRRISLEAQMKDLLGLISGSNTDLISYHEVARRVRAYQQTEIGASSIPLEKIVGSVGRYKDFTREFLPRNSISQDRWTRVDKVLHSLEGYPPIEVYQIGDVYFVRDGNHRISVARANGLTHIEAYVTVVASNIPFTLDDFDRDRWLIKIERAEFQEQTHLDELRPENNVFFTEPGRYQILHRHMFVHHYLRNLDLERAGSWERLQWPDAVASWYDNVYMPVVDAIRKYELLSQFPERTEADLYLWITYHREDLAAQYDLAPLSADAAVATFAHVYDDRVLQGMFKTARFGLFRAIGALERPMGMSSEEFDDARARYDAGERTLLEAETDEVALHAALDEDGQDAVAVTADDAFLMPTLQAMP